MGKVVVVLAKCFRSPVFGFRILDSGFGIRDSSFSAALSGNKCKHRLE